MKWRVDKINRILRNAYLKYYNTFSLNKNLLISGISGFLLSLVVAYFSAEYSVDFVLNSALTVITGYLTYKTIFAILFHRDNKRSYTKKLTGKLNFQKLKQILFKMLFASSVFDIVNNITRFILIIQLLKLEYSAVESATISSIIASILSYAVINLIIRYIHVFGSKK
ncbi:hypothetical protein [Candidatus Nitrosocosmicus arcticus]|uniref:Uncharacterized protein n=1 Tax=Candidatus Nitrosocosmicus arcticus TaxID=2035267 RepID=A0A557SVP0_9ARCH|nr:hypothetical protein [Candidatus Nitrosocosmicus arcticus]TVP40666.1 membrane protein of unknown function [Candidatus Nitrosocosmicus arcticus]